MSDAYDVALARVPGLGGFIASQNLRQRQGMGELQQAGALQGILMKNRAMQQEQEIKGILAQASQESGGDPAKMSQFLLGSANPAAVKLGIELKGLMPKPEGNKVVGNNLVDPYGNVIFQGEKAQKAPPSRHRPQQVGNSYFDVYEEMGSDGQWKEVGRKPIKDPTIVMPRQPHYERGVGSNGNLWVTPIIDGKPGQPIDTGVKPQGLTTSGNQQALALRRDYNNNPEVKLANSLEPKVGPTAEYIASVGTGMGNPVGDAELVKLWLMTTHPKGDQISNMDYRQIQAMPDLWGRIKNVAGNFVFGKTLDADTRRDMWLSISNKYKATASSRDKYKSDVINRGRSMNIDQSLIFGQEPE